MRVAWKAGPLFAAAVASILVGSRALAQGGVWTARAPMPTPRCCAAAAVIDGMLYVGGGFADPYGSLQTLEAYDAKTDTWTTKAPMATPRDLLAAAGLDGIVYALGGYNAQLGVVATVEAYDPRTNTWSSRAPMPAPRERLAVVALSGKLYAIGGLGTGFPLLGTVEAYDPETDTWSAKAPMPTPRYDLAAVAINGIIYAVGGNDIKDGTISAVEAYNPSTNTWTTKAAMPTPRDGLGVAVVAGSLYAIGGSDGHEYTTVERYDPAADAWTTAPPLPTGRHNLAVGAVEDTIYAVGGLGYNCCIGGEPFLGTNEAFSPFEMVSIDIKPGDANNTINLKSHGVIPVAILGSATFDPMTVDPSTVTLAGAHVVRRLTDGKGVAMTRSSDVNHDGYPDLVLFFRTEDMTALTSSSSESAGHRPALQQAEAVLYGTTYSGQRIRGSDSVRIVPAAKSSAARKGFGK